MSEPAPPGSGILRPRSGRRRVQHDAQSRALCQIRVDRAVRARGRRHQMYAEPLAVSGHGLQCSYDGTRRGASRTAERRGDQRVEVVHQDDQPGQRGRALRLRTSTGAQAQRPAGGGVQVTALLGGARRALAHHAVRELALGVPLGEAHASQQLGAALQLGTQRLGEDPHTDRVRGHQVLGDMR